jgi:hypothetical protein
MEGGSGVVWGGCNGVAQGLELTDGLQHLDAVVVVGGHRSGAGGLRGKSLSTLQMRSVSIGIGTFFIHLFSTKKADRTYK